MIRKTALVQKPAQKRQAVLERFDPTGPAYRHVSRLFDGDTPLGEVCDLLGYSLPLPLPVKQQLLNDPDVAARARALVAAVGGDDRRRPFPPVFSAN